MIGTNITQSVSNTAAATHSSAVAPIPGVSPVATGNFFIPQGLFNQLKSAPPGSSASDAVNVHRPITQGNTKIYVCHCGC